MAASETLRIRVEPGFKEEVTRMYEQRGTTVSAAVRAFLASELASYTAALDTFDSIMASADAKVQASGLREPTIEEINEYVSRIRAERSDDSLAAS